MRTLLRQVFAFVFSEYKTTFSRLLRRELARAALTAADDATTEKAETGEGARDASAEVREMFCRSGIVWIKF